MTVRVAPGFLPYLPMLLGDGVSAAIEAAPPPDAAGWIRLDLGFESLEWARSRLLAFGGGLEVLTPKALRQSIADYAAQVTQRYGRSESTRSPAAKPPDPATDPRRP